MVLDFSVSAVMGAGVGGKVGMSIVLEFKNDSFGFYPHYEYYYGAKYNTFGFSYSVGYKQGSLGWGIAENIFGPSVIILYFLLGY